MKKLETTADISSSYIFETYAIFQNTDRSILGANSFLEKFGYQFIRIDLEELEKKFSSLLSLPQNFISEEQVTFSDTGLSVSNEFYESLLNNHLFGHSTVMKQEVIFLKAINDFEQIVINNTTKTGISLHYTSLLQKFVTVLIQQFRLFKNGDIECLTQFQISKEKRFVINKLSGPVRKSYGNSIYSLTENDVEILGKTFKESFFGNSLTELAISSFNLSYSIADIKTKYITLMTCLESLFNQGRDQITHTVSRHLSLIVSESEQEFVANYYRIKELYQLRSAIVHGGTSKEDISKATDELQNLVRKAINYCQRLQLDKKQLFDKLNTLGFGRIS